MFEDGDYDDLREEKFLNWPERNRPPRLKSRIAALHRSYSPDPVGRVQRNNSIRSKDDMVEFNFSGLEVDGFISREVEDEQFLNYLWPFSSDPNIVDRTAYSPKSKRKKIRDIDTVYALVLHQAGFSRGNDPKKYNNVTSHFVIMPNGTILQLHPLTAYLYSSNGFNRGSVAVEFIGNFPSERGRCWKPEKYGCNQVSNDQIEAGRQLIRYLRKKIGLTHVLAHRQSSGSRGNDPGPDLWHQVGQWGVNKLGLNDGGHGFKIQSGKAIPDSWRKT